MQPPFSPEQVIDDFAALIRSYGVARVVGDRYAGEFRREQFRKRAIHYVCAEKAKSDLFRDLLPLLNSGRVVLPRSDHLTNQLTSLERRTSRAGKDSIDHSPGSHDDLANAVAGAASLALLADRNRLLRRIRLTRPAAFYARCGTGPTALLTSRPGGQNDSSMSAFGGKADMTYCSAHVCF